MTLRTYFGGALFLAACTSDQGSATTPGTTSLDGGTPGATTGGSAYAFGPTGGAIGVSIGTATTMVTIAADEKYGHASFALPGTLDAATSYTVAVSTPPAGQACKVYAGASGTGAELSVAGAVRVGCEWSFDFLGRSSDDKVQAYSNNSTGVVIGGDNGRYVAFRAGQAGLAPGSTDYRSIYWRDRMTGVTKLVSRTLDGSSPDGDSFSPAISADGLHVAFYSQATNLFANDANKVADVFVWSSVDESLKCVSFGPNGEASDGLSDAPSLSADGSIIAFTSQATTIVPTANDSTLADKVLRLDLAKGERTVVSRNKTSGYPTDGAMPMLSADGNRLVYWAYRDVTGDLNPDLWDIFVYDHAAQKQWPVSQGKTGENRQQGNESTSGVVQPAISGDGKWVTYGTTASNVVPGSLDKLRHVYLVEADHCDGTGCNVVRVDQGANGPGDAEPKSDYAPLSFDGRWVTFASPATNLGLTTKDANAYAYDRTTAALTPITNIDGGDGGIYTSVALSPDGAYAVFGSYVKHDARFDTDGIFAAFTGHANAFAWQTGSVQH